MRYPVKMHFPAILVLLASTGMVFPLEALSADAAAGGVDMSNADFTEHWAGWLAIAIFVVAYGFVIAEENLH